MTERATVALVTGHLFRGSEMHAQAQEAADGAIRRQAEAILARRRIGTLFSALACGSDIIVAERALEAGIELHVVLPFPFEPFAALSIDIGDPPGRERAWRRRAEGIVNQAASVTVVEERAPPPGERDAYFHHGFRFMAGLALIHAEAIGGECRLIAVTDGTQAVGLAGANRAAADWRRTGRPLDEISFPFERPPSSRRAASTSPFRPIVLAWLPPVGAVLSGNLPTQEFRSPEGRQGRAAIVDSPAAALALAERLAALQDVRVVCAFAPVQGADGMPRAGEIDRLVACIEPGIGEAGAHLATLAFAAETILESPDAFARLAATDSRFPGNPPAARSLFRIRVPHG